MTSTTGFTAGDTDNSTSSGTISDTTVEYKYAQMVVPSFQVVDAPDGTGDTISWSSEAASPTTPSGNSFVRLGSFPVTATATKDATSGAYSYAMTTDPNSDAPTGFTDSLTLAKLVGDVSAVASAEASDDSTKTDGDHLFTDDDGDPFAGNKLLGFVDDTRIRDDATSTNLYIKGSSAQSSVETNSTGNRKAETRRLLTKGGWWDHSDGNRISTTAGDKVEVIQGNYKLVVLGRRAASDTGDVKATDMSGGYDYSKTYEYLESEGIWASYEYSSAKNATKVTSGKEVTYFTGTLKETIIGKDPGSVDPETPKTWIKGANDAKDPVVRSKTWAQSIETYVGTVNKPVPVMTSVTWSHTREEISVSSEIFVLRVADLNYSQINMATTMLDAKVAVGLAKWDVAAWVHEWKTGTVFTYNATSTVNLRTTKTNVVAAAQTAVVKEDKLAVLESKIAQQKDLLTLAYNTLSGRITRLSNQVTSIVGDDVSIAVVHQTL